MTSGSPQFPTIEKHITAEKMRRFMGQGNQSIHADPEKAKSWGMGSPIVQGGQLVAYLSELMLRTFGEGFLNGGEISVAFVKAVRAGDTVRAKAGMERETVVDGRKRVDCRIWLENQAGETVTAGTASAFVSSVQQGRDRV